MNRDPFNPVLHTSDDNPEPHCDYGRRMLPTGDAHYWLTPEESKVLCMKRGISSLTRGDDLLPSLFSDNDLLI